DFRKLLSVISPTGPAGGMNLSGVRDRAMLWMMWDTGARAGELMALDIDDIDLDRMSARIKTEKSRGTIPFREIFWKKEANEALGEWLEAREEFFKDKTMADPQAVFVGIKPGGHQKRPNGRRIVYNYPADLMRKYSNKAGLE